MIIYDENVATKIKQITEIEEAMQQMQEIYLSQLDMLEAALDEEPGDTITLPKETVRKLIHQTIAFAASAQGDMDRVKEYLDRL
jgi:hypothetical protein